MGDRGRQTRIKNGPTSSIAAQLRIYDESSHKISVWESRRGMDEFACYQLKVIMATMPMMKPSAILYQSDVFMVVSDAFSKHHRIPEDAPPEKFMEQYSDILQGQYQGSLCNVPEHVRSDAILTFVKGPGIQPIGLFTAYRCTECSVVMGETKSVGQELYFGMVPDWWSVSVN